MIRMALIAVAVVGFFTAVCGVVQAGTVYYDNFDGSSAADLNGTAPDVASGSQTWAAGSLIKADGSKSTDGNANAWLPFTPISGNRYTLSIDANPDISTSTDWLSLGFARGNGTTNMFQDGPNAVAAWLLNRENDASTSAVQTFPGPGTASGASHDFDPDKVGPVNLQVMLDTHTPLWTVEWFVDGVSIRGPVAYATNPVTQYAGFAGYGTATGVVDNFLLSEENPSGTQIGLGPGVGTSLDSGGARLNVEEASVHLIAGRYDVLDFAFNAGATDGNATPFLAKLTGDNTYETLWVGPAFSPSQVDVQADTYAAGTEQFTLSEATEVYAGFVQDNALVRYGDPDGPSLTDHDNAFTLPTGPGQIIGDFSHAGLSRNYAFRVNVSEPVPEPSTVVLFGFGLVLLGYFGWRRKR